MTLSRFQVSAPPASLLLNQCLRMLTSRTPPHTFRKLQGDQNNFSTDHHHHHHVDQSPSVSADEVAKFSLLSGQWWDPDGPFRMLHLMNPVRVEFLRQSLELADINGSDNSSDSTSMNHCRDEALPFSGLRMLDVGCGGGLLSESLRRLGGHVVGIDASQKNIQAASHHARTRRLLGGKVGEKRDNYSSLRYLHSTAESLANDADHRERYDVVCALEIIEHVNQPHQFLRTCMDLLRPGGLLCVSTINRTPLSYLMGIVMAERVLCWVPQGTHDYSKFISPAELHQMMRGMRRRVNQAGMWYNPLCDRWSLAHETTAGSMEMNYIVAAVK